MIWDELRQISVSVAAGPMIVSAKKGALTTCASLSSNSATATRAAARHCAHLGAGKLATSRFAATLLLRYPCLLEIESSGGRIAASRDSLSVPALHWNPLLLAGL